jgi:hypothetical protein
MSYTSTGKSTGTATVIFKDKGSATKAHAACMCFLRFVCHHQQA